MRAAEQLGSPDAAVQADAENRLKVMGEEAVAALAQVANRPVPPGERPSLAQKNAIRLLGDMALSGSGVGAKAADELVLLVASPRPEIAGHAAAALKPMGHAALRLLAPVAMGPDQARARPARSAMVLIDEIATIDLMVGALSGGARYGATEPDIIAALGDLTHNDFGYDPAQTKEERQIVVEKWVRWWTDAREHYKKPIRAEEFVPKADAKK